ncbi:MAG: hypothetical protein U0326_42135 [Polyangiales bacterium]
MARNALHAPCRVTFASPKEPAAEAPLVGVVVTLHDASSYDPLFREYKLEPPDGRVSVWECSSSALRPLLDTLHGDRPARDGDVYDELAAELASVDAESVVFNWECCGGCSDAGFIDTSLVMRAAEVLLARGYTLMFSDFSLKALISAWRAAAATGAFGPCPLVKLGEFSSRFELRFDPATLRACGSAQLERVGELCENGEASVAALGGTIAYALDAEVAANAPYRAEVLTVATDFEGSPALSRFADSLRGGRVSVVGAHRGAAGHVRITFPRGGVMLLSCGHWVELVKLDVTAERLVQVAEQVYGAEGSQKMAKELADAAPEQRAQLVQNYAKQFVNQSSPARYSKKQ